MTQITAVLMKYVAPGLWQATGIHATDLALASALGQPLTQVDLAEAADKASMMSAFARDLKFGSYFGKNFDALEECLNDLAPGTALTVIKNGDELAKAAPKVIATLNEILNDVSAASGQSFVWIDTDVEVPTIPNFWA